MDDRENMYYFSKIQKERGPNNQGIKKMVFKEYKRVIFNNIKLSSEINQSKFPFIKEKEIQIFFLLFLPDDKEKFEHFSINSQLEKGFTKPDLFNQIKNFYLKLSKENGNVFYINNEKKSFEELKLREIYIQEGIWVVDIF
jgi:hypothetical protein